MNSSISNNNNNNNMTSSWASVAKSPKVLNTTIIPTEVTHLDNKDQLADLSSLKVAPVVSALSINLGEFGISKPKKVKKIKFPLKFNLESSDVIESTSNLENKLKTPDNRIIESTEIVCDVVCDVNDAKILAESEVDQIVEITDTTCIESASAVELVFETHITKGTNIIAKDTNIITKNTNIVTKNTGIVTKNTNIVAKDTNAIAKNTNAIIKDTNAIIKDTNAIIKDTNVITKDQSVVNNSGIVRNADISGSKTIVESERLFALELCENIKNAEISGFAHLQAETARLSVYNSLSAIDIGRAEELSDKVYKSVYEEWYVSKRNALKISNIANEKGSNTDCIDNTANESLSSHRLYSVANDLATSRITIKSDLSTDKVIVENNLLDIMDIPILGVGNKSSYLAVSKKKCVAVKNNVVDKSKPVTKNKLIVNKRLESGTKQTREEHVVLSNLKKEEILVASKVYARSLINSDEIIASRDSYGIDWRGCLHTINVDCHHTKLGFTTCGMSIFPRNFLDNTFIVGTTYSTNSHQSFRKEFLSILEEHVSNIHVRFEKNSEDPLLFAISFYNKREIY
jgi:hypothetical protein